jgi:hypothetical protein
VKHVGLALLLVGAWIGLSAGAWAQTAVAPVHGDGATTDTAYQITSLDNLVWLHDQAATGATYGKYYKLMNAIDASATANWNDSGTDASVLEGFNPIGNDLIHTFNGSFDGAGHQITGLVVNRSLADYIGLFGIVGSYGQVKNLGLVVGSMTGGDEYVGDLVGRNYGTVSTCYATGAVTGSDENVGGLIGWNDGTVTECYATGAVTGSGSGWFSFVGGLVGENYGTVSQCYATGAVTGSYDYVDGSYFAGGLVGENSGTVSQCYATGAMPGGGGLVRLGTASDSYWNTETTGQPFSYGGGTGKTTAEMTQQATFTDWDFTTVWGIQGAYPYLRAMTTHALTYMAGAHGLLGSGTTSGTTLMQTVNEGSTGAPVTALADTDSKFTSWSDSSTTNPRTDDDVMSDVSVTATFAIRAAAREWRGYR